MSDERQTDTSIPMVAVGGAVASIALYLLSPLLESWVGEEPPPGMEAALGTLITAAITYWLPARWSR